ncbi:beta-ketoacyl-ACP synthase [Flocculibacter collagenilyticus]|uniref:beta-ketoacyl-ACP synthase n=1 Tax=Flocculibacter collagenilyticus TaxID=2744479 RepID=UPI0018F4E358|nr:beta-ketoacyl-ACP synthase [Flocculibacter collagenilyticus]
MAINLNDLGIVCALGEGKTAVFDSLINHPEKEYLLPDEHIGIGEQTFYTGQVKVSLPQLSHLPKHLQSRNNQLLLNAYEQIKDSVTRLSKNVPNSRIAVVIGTSTSGILEGEQARSVLANSQKMPDEYHYATQEMGAPAEFIAHVMQAEGPVYSISTACSSSAKALVSAKALIESDLADIVICGGVDTLSRLPINGFKALESTAEAYCNPFCEDRDGINIGEGAALFVMSKQTSGVALIAAGETSDAYHVSSPSPEGEGAYAAMETALNISGITKNDIDYVNLHGTGTIKNDDMEAKAIYRLFGQRVPVSSTKRFTGHTLGAAGAIEAGLTWLLLSTLNKDNAIPVNKCDLSRDKSLSPINLSQGQKLDKLVYCMTNSFAFGGNNISLLLGKTQ